MHQKEDDNFNHPCLYLFCMWQRYKHDNAHLGVLIQKRSWQRKRYCDCPHKGLINTKVVNVMLKQLKVILFCLPLTPETGSCGKMLTLTLAKSDQFKFLQTSVVQAEGVRLDFRGCNTNVKIATLSPSEENVSRSLAGKMSKARCHMAKDCEPTVGSLRGDGYLPVDIQG